MHTNKEKLINNAHYIEYGYDWQRQGLKSSELAELQHGLKENSSSQHSGLRQVEQLYPTVKALLSSHSIHRILDQYLGEAAFYLRGILFDKRPQRNWPVSWHQDLALVCSDPQHFPKIKTWREKSGLYHHQGHRLALEHMLTLRIHIDTARHDNGCLQLIPKSHKQGILTESQIQQIKNQNGALYCEAMAGDILVMNPLIVHASARLQSPQQRRILHLEFIPKRLLPEIYESTTQRVSNT